MELREWYIKAAKRFGWSKTELIANIAEKVYENIVLDFDTEMCSNTTEEENAGAINTIFNRRTIQTIPWRIQSWNPRRKKYRRRWYTMLWMLSVE